MQIKDFDGISHLRFLVPLIYVICWTSMIFGTQYFPFMYREYSLGIFAFLAFKGVLQCYLNFMLVLKSNKVLKRVQNPAQKSYSPLGQVTDQIYHAFIIPSYKEDIELLAETLEVLAQHKRATSTYLIYLAMEKHQEGSDKKAEELIQRFKNKFRNIDYTRHEIKVNQSKGKASNVSWCAQHMADSFKTLMIQEDNVFLTVIDADSWAPDVYFDQVQDHIRENYQTRHNVIYQPPQVFTRNNMQVPMIVRAYDDMYSSMHASNLITCTGITFSLSNYSLSYNLIKKIGFWDTVEQAIGEDVHICLKAAWKTDGSVKTVPIFAPFNQISIQTGEGAIEDLKAKFWQIQRHARAISEISYCLLMLFRQKFSMRAFLNVFTLIEMLLMPIIIPWSIIAILIQDDIVHAQVPEGILSSSNFMMLFNIANFTAFSACFFFEFFKRRASEVLYGIKSPHILRCLESPLLYGFNVFCLTFPSYLIASFGSLKKNRQYVVADKVLAKNQPNSQENLLSSN